MYQKIDNIYVWGVPIMNAVEQMKRVARTAHITALMSDHHLGYAVPVGGVVGYIDQVSPSGVGYDIGCGNNAIMTDLLYSDIRSSMPKIMDDMFKTLSFGVGRVNNEPVEHELFESDTWKQIPFLGTLKQMAENQLGTIGSGNHYVDIFREQGTDAVWISNHFGSRGFGHKIATHYLQLAGGKDGIDVEPVVLDVNSDLGREYILAMTLAGEYANAGREWVTDRVAKLIGANTIKTVKNHHNFAWKENHFGEEMWVVRKGATPLFPGQESFIGSTMTDVSYVIEGMDSDEAQLTLHSTVHGAGREHSRTWATGKMKYVKGKRVPVGIGNVTQEMMDDVVSQSGIELRGAGVDESPFCYKKLDDVLSYHAPTFKVKHALIPVGVAMAGPDVTDPFAD